MGKHRPVICNIFFRHMRSDKEGENGIFKGWLKQSKWTSISIWCQLQINIEGLRTKMLQDYKTYKEKLELRKKFYELFRHSVLGKRDALNKEMRRSSQQILKI